MKITLLVFIVCSTNDYETEYIAKKFMLGRFGIKYGKFSNFYRGLLLNNSNSFLEKLYRVQNLFNNIVFGCLSTMKEICISTVESPLIKIGHKMMIFPSSEEKELSRDMRVSDKVNYKAYKFCKDYILGTQAFHILQNNL